MPAPALLPIQSLAKRVTKMVSDEAQDISFVVPLAHQVILGFDKGEVVTPESLKLALARRLEQLLCDLIDTGGSVSIDVARIDECAR